MYLIQEYLQSHSYEELKANYNIFVGYHKELPLIVLNYHATKSKRFDPLVEECRGLILELESNKIIAVGMPRFYNYGEGVNNNNYEFHKGMRCENKEDGTLLHFFYYKDQWVLANRYNFCDDIVNQAVSELTYQQVFEETCGYTIQELGSKLDKNVTYCLEMCTLVNAIIKLYQKPQIFLICAYDNNTLLELPHDVVTELLPSCWSRPNHTTVDSLSEIFSKIESNPDICFEGYVIINKHNQRIKIKSKCYRIIHSLKYHGWASLTYDNALYLVNLNIVDQVLEVISHYRNSFDIKEIQHKIKMFLTHGKNYNALDVNHPKQYCELKDIPSNIIDSGIATTTPIKINNNNVFNSWSVTCYCGAPMPLRRLKCEFSLYKTCHCKSIFDIKTYYIDTYLYICDTCNLTHEAYQYTMTVNNGEILPCYQPTGIPASDVCKNVRLHVHQLINKLIKEHNFNKNQVYALISELTNKDRKDTHIGKFDIYTCYDVILKLQNYIKNLSENK